MGAKDYISSLRHGREGQYSQSPCPMLWGILAARGETPRCTEIGAAPAWQGATREQIGAFVTEEQRRHTGCSADRMQWGFHHGLLGDENGRVQGRGVAEPGFRTSA